MKVFSLLYLTLIQNAVSSCPQYTAGSFNPGVCVTYQGNTYETLGRGAGGQHIPGAPDDGSGFGWKKIDAVPTPPSNCKPYTSGSFNAGVCVTYQGNTYETLGRGAGGQHIPGAPDDGSGFGWKKINTASTSEPAPVAPPAPTPPVVQAPPVVQVPPVVQAPPAPLVAQTPPTPPVAAPTPPVVQAPPASATPPVAQTPPTPETPPVAQTPPTPETPPVAQTPPTPETPPAPVETPAVKAASTTADSTFLNSQWVSDLNAAGLLTDADTKAKINNVNYYVRTRSSEEINAISPGNPNNPENVRRVERILTQDMWNQFFPYTNKDTAEGSPEGLTVYTYTNFLKAVGAFPAYCGDYKNHPDPNMRTKDSDMIARRLLATTFAHFTKETGANAGNWKTPMNRQGLYFVNEAGCKNGACGGYTMGAEYFPGLIGQNTYFGRGAKQLSHPANYATLSLLLFGDAGVLLKNPDLVSTTWLALGSAIYFAVVPVSSKPSMIEIIDGNYTPNASDLEKNFTPGFSLTTHIINGGIECMTKPGPVDTAGIPFWQVRLNYYQDFAKALGVDTSKETGSGCTNVSSLFGLDSTASRPYYIGPKGSSLVSYETPFIAYGGKKIIDLAKSK